MREMATADAVGQVLCHDLTTRLLGTKERAQAFPKGAYHPGEETTSSAAFSVGGKTTSMSGKRDESMLHESRAADIHCIILENMGSGGEGRKDRNGATRDGLLRLEDRFIKRSSLLGNDFYAYFYS